MAMIELRHLTKTYGTGESAVKALDDVSLEIEQGEIFGIIGLSGAGKSTLVRCINLLETPTAGEVIVDGKTMTDLKGKALREAAYPAQLSGGMKQRVAIARALASNPRVLLCDEATSALDPTTTESILELLKDINRTMGVTVVVITHEMRVVERICSRVAIIADSHIAEMGEVQEVFLHPRTEAAKKLVLPSRSGKLEGFTEDEAATAVDECRGELIRLAFDGTTTDRPVIADMILSCGAPVSIVYADTRSIEGKLYGHTVLQLPSDAAVAEKMKRWLNDQGISYTKEVQ